MYLEMRVSLFIQAWSRVWLVKLQQFTGLMDPQTTHSLSNMEALPVLTESELLTDAATSSSSN